ncbi:MAG: endolytic transglycosylase MltG [Thermoanaerobaculia bacterium]
MVALLLFAIAAGVFLWRALTTPYSGYRGEARLVEIKKGWTSSAIMKHLRREGVLRDDFFPLLYVKVARRGDSMKAGVYQFERPLSPVEVIDKLVRGDVVLRTVTVREGLDRFAIAELMVAEGFGTVARWKEITSDPELIRDLDPDASSLEGYLFPDTYKLAPGTTPEAIVKTMVDNFRKNFGDELAFIANGLDIHQTVTLASIVETEARLPQERPMIASVYLNRVEKRMPLQADPTVIYAMKLRGTWNGNIRKSDLALESPYNTYRSRGFPPGPIANPGLESLRAAAAPARTDYLYFVSRNDGSHAFARNLAEHNRNVEEHQRRYFRRRRAEGR